MIGFAPGVASAKTPSKPRSSTHRTGNEQARRETIPARFLVARRPVAKRSSARQTSWENPCNREPTEARGFPN